MTQMNLCYILVTLHTCVQNDGVLVEIQIMLLRSKKTSLHNILVEFYFTNDTNITIYHYFSYIIIQNINLQYIIPLCFHISVMSTKVWL